MTNTAQKVQMFLIWFIFGGVNDPLINDIRVIVYHLYNKDTEFGRESQIFEKADILKFTISALYLGDHRTTMKSIVLYLLLIIAPDLLFSQGTFRKSFPIDRNVESLAVLQATDGNYLLYGRSFDPGIYNCFILKTGPGGDSLWTRFFLGVNNMGISNSPLLETEDSGFCFISEYAGTTLLIHTSKSGDSIWSATFPYLSKSTLQSTDDGGYVLCGWEYDSISRVSLIKTNDSGTELWRKPISWVFPSGPWGFKSPADLSILQTNDNGFIVSGNNLLSLVDPPFPFFTFAFLIRTNSNGDSLWTKKIDNFPFQRISGIQLTSGNGFITAGSLDSNTNWNMTHLNGYVLRFDENGDTLWTKSYGGTGNQDFYSFEKTDDGGYICCGVNKPDFGSSGYYGLYLVRINADGDTLWIKFYPGGLPGWKDMVGTSVRQTTDHGFIVCGVKYDSLYNEYLFLIKTDALGNVYPQGINNQTPVVALFPFPNPSSGWVFLNPPGNFGELEVSDMMGNTILRDKIDPHNTSTIKINLSGNPAGVYLLQMKNEWVVLTGKILLN